MKRKTIDFTDKELYYVALAFQSHINDRDFYTNKGGRRVITNAMQKVIDNGFTRTNHKSILAPLVQFNNDNN